MRWVALLALAACAGCTYVNRELNPQTLRPEARVHNHTRAELGAEIEPVNANPTSPRDVKIGPATAPVQLPRKYPRDDGYFVGLAISGGGSRSANFAAACMFHLERLGILQRVDYISSVSGGSLPAAYYCISDDTEWNPKSAQEKLTHHFATDLIVHTLLPWNGFWMLVSNWDRSDVLAESFERVLYTQYGRKLTFSDLREERPRLLINATDLQTGKSFVFCNETFDQINSDLSNYPLGNAVAASSAVPVLLHQVTLRDFNTSFAQFRHLVDGGVVDNLGVRTLVQTYQARIRDYPNGAVFIVIDAKTNYDAKVSSKGDTTLLETIQFGASISTTVLLNRASSATLAEIILDSSPADVTAATLRQERDQLMNDGYVQLNVKDRPVHVLHLALSRVNEIPNLPFKSFSESVNSISTYFNIDSPEAAALYEAADLLVRERFVDPLGKIVEQLHVASTQPAR